MHLTHPYPILYLFKDKELFNLKQNYESQKQTSVSDVVREEVDKREEMQREKDDEIHELHDEIKELRVMLDERTNQATAAKESLSRSLQTTKASMGGEVGKLSAALQVSDRQNVELKAKVEELDKLMEELKSGSAGSSVREETLKVQVEAFKGKLDMLVVCLENELKFGESIENGLLNSEEHTFRTALREMNGFFDVRVREAIDKTKDPLEKVIDELRLETRGLTIQVGVQSDARSLAEDRVRELTENEKELERRLGELLEAQQELVERSQFAEDMERSRSEVAMLAELQRIEGESEVKGLKGEIMDLKRKNQEEQKEMERDFGKEMHEERERVRVGGKKVMEEKNELVLEHEEVLTEERSKYTKLQDRLHRESQEFGSRFSDLQGRYFALQNEVEGLKRRREESQFLALKENIEGRGGGGGGDFNTGGGDGGKIGISKRVPGSSMKALEERLAAVENLTLEFEGGGGYPTTVKKDNRRGGGGDEAEDEGGKGGLSRDLFGGGGEEGVGGCVEELFVEGTESMEEDEKNSTEKSPGR